MPGVMDRRDVPAQRRSSSFAAPPRSPRDRYEDSKDSNYDEGARDYRYSFHLGHANERDRLPRSPPPRAPEASSPVEPINPKPRRNVVWRNPLLGKPQSNSSPEKKQEKAKIQSLGGLTLDGTTTGPGDGQNKSPESSAAMEVDQTTPASSAIAQTGNIQDSTGIRRSAHKGVDAPAKMVANTNPQTSPTSQPPPPLLAASSALTLAQTGSSDDQSKDGLPQPTADISQLVQLLVYSHAKRVHTERDVADAKELCKQRLQDLERVRGSKKAALQAMQSSSNSRKLLDNEQKLSKRLQDETEESRKAAHEFAEFLRTSSMSRPQDPNVSYQDESLLRNNRELAAKNNELESRLAKLEALVGKVYPPTPPPETHNLVALKDQVSKLETVTCSALDRVKNLETDQDDQMEQMQRTETTLNMHKAKYDRARVQLEQLKEQFESLQQHFVHFQERFDLFEQRFDTLRAHSERFKNGLEPVHDQLSQFQNKLKRLQKDEAGLKEMVQHYGTGFETFRETCRDDLAGIISQIQPQVEALRVNTTQTLTEHRSMVEDLSKQVSEITREQTALAPLKSRLVKESNGSDTSASLQIGMLQTQTQEKFRLLEETQKDTSSNMQTQLQNLYELVAKLSKSASHRTEPNTPTHAPTYPIAANSSASASPMFLARTVPNQSNSGATVRQNSNDALWKTTNALSSSSSSLPSASMHESAVTRELSDRLVSAERMIGFHEQRLNYTSYEAIWPTLTRFVAEYVANHYPYPESVKNDIAELRTNGSRLETSIADQIQSLTNTLNKESSEISAKLKTQDNSLAALEATSDTGKIAMSKYEAEISKFQSRLSEMANRYLVTATKHSELEAKLDKQTSMQCTSDRAAQPTDLVEWVTKLQENIQSLETYCFTEVSTLTGKIAKVSKLAKVSSTMPSIDGPRLRRIESGKRNDSTSSSDESIIASRRKRKRPE